MLCGKKPTGHFYLTLNVQCTYGLDVDIKSFVEINMMHTSIYKCITIKINRKIKSDIFLFKPCYTVKFSFLPLKLNKKENFFIRSIDIHKDICIKCSSSVDFIKSNVELICFFHTPSGKVVRNTKHYF